MRTTILTTLFIATLGYTLTAQVMGNYGVQQQTYNNVNPNVQYRAVPKAAQLLGNNNIQITINALCNRAADSYTAIFSVLQTGKTAEETNTLMNQRIDAVRTELISLGIPAADIYLDMVNFLPRYEYDVSKKMFSKKTYTEIPKGFELQKNLHIRYKKAELLDKIVTAASKQEIYDIVKADYFVLDHQAVYTQLRKAAFEYLNGIKTQYRTIGVQLDSAKVQMAENAWVAYPINRYETYKAYSSQSMDMNEKNATYNNVDKPIARFYNAIPANDYDIVINPELLEPAVQFSYNLVFLFTLPERKIPTKTEVQKEVILITPTGEMRTLKIE